MNRVCSIKGTLEALSPIQHAGDEKTGSTSILRSITIWDVQVQDHIRLPMISGNAIRGLLRRMIMRDMLEQVDYEIENKKLHHALYTGGVLESTDETSASADLEFRRFVRDAIPPVGLLGTAIGNQMIAGSLKVDHAIPVCLETAYMLPGELKEDNRAQQSVRTFTDVSFATRRDDLRAGREEDEQATQMKIEFEVFIAGTLFSHAFTLVYANELETSCLGYMMDLLAECPYLCGKSGSGYGKVRMEYPNKPSGDLWMQYLNDNRDALRGALEKVGERLSGK